MFSFLQLRNGQNENCWLAEVKLQYSHGWENTSESGEPWQLTTKLIPLFQVETAHSILSFNMTALLKHDLYSIQSKHRVVYPSPQSILAHFHHHNTKVKPTRRHSLPPLNFPSAYGPNLLFGSMVLTYSGTLDK